MPFPRVVFEISWEVCNMVGGIHTVIASHAAEMIGKYGDGYITVGPKLTREDNATPVFRPEVWMPELLESLAGHDVGVQMGRWLVPGEPRCLLINHSRLYAQKNEILSRYWERFELDSLFGGWDYYDPLLFAHASGLIIEHMRDRFFLKERREVVVHAHEWLSGAAVLHVKAAVPDVGTVFTTHATMLGRAASAHHPGEDLHALLPTVNPAELARSLNVSAKHSMESVTARECDVFTTVSELTARECDHLLGRTPDPILPNGFGAHPVPPERAATARERLFRIAELATCARYDRDKTTVAVLAGRYEYVNKGVDVFIDAAAALRGSEWASGGRRLLAFVMMPTGHAQPKRVLSSRARGEPCADEPLICTHDLIDEHNDPTLRRLRELGVANASGDLVHVVYVPIYLDGSDALIPDRYWDLLPGADIGVFPSRYEPWGYTPLECVSFGVPTVTSDLTGFGQWVKPLGDFRATGVDVLPREGRSAQEATATLAERLEGFMALDDGARAELRAACLRTAGETDWSHFAAHYYDAHGRAAAAAAQRRRETPLDRLLEAARTEAAPIAERPAAHAFRRAFTVANTLPTALEPLRDLAANLWWRWHPRAADLFERLHPELWTEVGEDPHALLERVPSKRLRALAEDAGYVATLTEVHRAMTDALHGASSKPQIAYFCMEFGLAGFLPLYSGGLGILAGDHLKAASDLGLPLCAVGLAHQHGYFRQLIDADGHQDAAPDTLDFTEPPFTPVLDQQYLPLTVEVAMPTGPVQVRAWQLAVGRVSLYLLDTNVEGNTPAARQITDRLYGGDLEHRLRQEVILGLGGHALLDALGFEPLVYHMNEGHSAALVLARLRYLVRRRGLRLYEALDYVRNTTVFTTHTPVPAGHDHFGEDLVRPYLAPFESQLGVDWPRLMALGRMASRPTEEFGTTALAVRASEYVNGVSAKHGEVTRSMFRELYPEIESPEDVPVGSITNGVHVPTWLAAPWQEHCEQAMGADWQTHLATPERWAWVRDLPNADVWAMHRELRGALVAALERHLEATWARRADDPAILRLVLDRLHGDGAVLTFARRFAPYKRAELLLEDPERLARVFERHPDAVLLYAGKAHPADGLGRDLLRRVHAISRRPELLGRVVLLEGYDIDLARRLVSGSDVWVNTPTRGLEASGTSGMKAAINGCLNLSVDDGWWIEGYDGDNGWNISLPSAGIRDAEPYDRATLFGLLETEVLPCYADRDEGGVPHRWVERMKASVASIIPRFSTRRMLEDYVRLAYDPARADAAALLDDQMRPLLELTDTRARLVERWPELRVEGVEISRLGTDEVPVGAPIPLRLKLLHEGLDAQDLVVEAVAREGHGGGGRIVQELSSPGGAGASVWSGALVPQAGGRYELRFRVRPRQRREGRAGKLGLHIERWL